MNVDYDKVNWHPFNGVKFTLLEDNGWYKANYNMVEKLDWG